MQNAGNLQFGISKSSATATVSTAGNFSFGTSYLIVLRYDVVSGSLNDNMYMWVNPGLATEPTIAAADLVINSGADPSYGLTIDALMIQQRSANSPVSAFDGFRVANGPTSLQAWNNLNPEGGPLPVKLLRFIAQSRDDGVRISWILSDEIGLSGYEVQRSNNGLDFLAIGFVQAVHQPAYTYTDVQPVSYNNFYRLRILENDGHARFSQVVTVKAGLTNLLLFPNPVKDHVDVKHSKAAGNTRLQLFTAEGKLVRDLQLPSNSVRTPIDCRDLRPGLYYVIFNSPYTCDIKTMVKE